MTPGNGPMMKRSATRPATSAARQRHGRRQTEPSDDFGASSAPAEPEAPSIIPKARTIHPLIPCPATVWMIMQPVNPSGGFHHETRPKPDVVRPSSPRARFLPGICCDGDEINGHRIPLNRAPVSCERRSPPKPSASYAPTTQPWFCLSGLLPRPPAPTSSAGSGRKLPPSLTGRPTPTRTRKTVRRAKAVGNIRGANPHPLVVPVIARRGRWWRKLGFNRPWRQFPCSRSNAGCCAMKESCLTPGPADLADIDTFCDALGWKTAWPRTLDSYRSDLAGWPAGWPKRKPKPLR